MQWFQRSNKNIEDSTQKEVPDGLFIKCPECSAVTYKRQYEELLFTCHNCGHHFRITSPAYISFLFDEDTFVETHRNVRSGDKLEFVDTRPYTQRLEDAHRVNEVAEAITTGYGLMSGIKVSFAGMNFSFIGGSMGSVVGEKLYRAAQLSLEERVPLLVICASGGARMQEAAFSLMQMAKTSAILGRLSEAGIPYITLLTDPTTGGVSASFGMLGDVIIAEPKALIGFAGPRVIEQTIRKKLPTGFQKSEFLLEHGFVDMIVHRKNLKNTIVQILGILAPTTIDIPKLEVFS